MKNTILIALSALTLITGSLYAGVSSIIPGRTETPFLDIFSPENKLAPKSMMKVRTSLYNNQGIVSKSKNIIQMPLEKYLLAMKQSRAVYRMENEYEAEAGSLMAYMGTAFHIGENLVLTNHHVLSPDRSNSHKCAGFKLYANESKDIFTCKKVHSCNVEHDVCLIEMNPAVRCKNLFCTNSEKIEMKQGEALKLKARPEVSWETMDTTVMSCIGNTLGLGIHFSQGRGVSIQHDRTVFYAPLRSGNSGGPLIGEDGLVWGVVKLESAKKVGEDAYNVAASIEKVISLMREQLSGDQVVLDKFNQSIIEN